MNISRLIDTHFSGNKASLASVAGVSRQAVTQWPDSDVLKAEYVIPVCASLDWRVTPHEIRPDIYPNPADGIPQLDAAA